MKTAGAAVLLLASSCFITPVMHFGGGKTPKESQHEVLTKVTPPALLVDAEWVGEVRVAKIRVWGDDDYRAQNVHWEQSFQEQLDYANEVMASLFGVRFEAEYRAWHHRATGATLAESLGDLAKQDRGDDVMTVVGLTSSTSLVSATFEQLGYASVPGRHLVLRGYADLEERRAFDQLFRDLRPDERASLYQARRRHKTAALLLHELGHNFGAQHQVQSNTLMNAIYSDHSTSFDATSRAVILASVDERLHRAPKPEARTASPSAPPPAPHSAHPTLVIAIDPSGQAFVGGNAVDDATLDGLFHLSFDDDHETAIVIQTSHNAPHSAVAKVLDHAKAAGLQHLSITTGNVP